MRFVLVVCLVLVAGLQAEEKREPTSEVTGTAVIPAALASFTGRVLEIRLYKHDPRIADKAADLVEKVEVKDFAHTTGKDTLKTFALGKKAKLESGMGYYLTLFVLDGKTRTHIGKCDHVKEPFNKVLTKGNPNKVRAVFREVK